MYLQRGFWLGLGFVFDLSVFLQCSNLLSEYKHQQNKINKIRFFGLRCQVLSTTILFLSLLSRQLGSPQNTTLRIFFIKGGPPIQLGKNSAKNIFFGSKNAYFSPFLGPFMAKNFGDFQFRGEGVPNSVFFCKMNFR